MIANLFKPAKGQKALPWKYDQTRFVFAPDLVDAVTAFRSSARDEGLADVDLQGVEKFVGASGTGWRFNYHALAAQ